jgi:type IV secretory pathway VirB4 component
MYRLECIHRHYKDTGALHSRVNLFGFWDQETFITKTGDPGLVLRVAGADYESLDHAARDHVVKRFEAAVRSFDETIRFYQILVKGNASPVTTSAHPNPLIQSAMEQRTAFLDSRADQLFRLEIYFVLIGERDHKKASASSAIGRVRDILGRDLVSSFAADRAAALAQEQIEAEVQRLRQQAISFAQQLEDMMKIHILPAQEAFHVMYALLNVSPGKRNSARLIADHGVDYQLSDSQVEAHRGHLRLDDDYVKVLTMKEPPSQTWPLF